MNIFYFNSKAFIESLIKSTILRIYYQFQTLILSPLSVWQALINIQHQFPMKVTKYYFLWNRTKDFRSVVDRVTFVINCFIYFLIGLSGMGCAIAMTEWIAFFCRSFDLFHWEYQVHLELTYHESLFLLRKNCPLIIPGEREIFWGQPRWWCSSNLCSVPLITMSVHV